MYYLLARPNRSIRFRSQSPVKLTGGDEDIKTTFFYGWVIVAVSATLGFLGTGFYSYSRGIFLDDLSIAIANGDRTEISFAFSSAFVMGTLMAPFIGRLLDRSSPKRVLMCGVAIVTCSYLLLSQVETILQFYLVTTIGMGLGMACMGGLAWHRSIINWFDHWRGRAIALGVLGASLSGIVMPQFVPELIENFGWQTTYGIFAVSTAITLFPVVFFLMKDKPEEMGEVRDGLSYVQNLTDQEANFNDEADNAPWSVKQMLRSPAFWSIGLIFGSMSAVFNATMLHMFSHIKDMGLNAAMVLSVTALFSAVGKPIIGWLSDYAGSRITIWLALISQVVGLLLFSQAYDFKVALLAASLYGFGYSGMSPLRTFSLSTSLGSNTYATASGVLKYVEAPIVLAASPMAGYIKDITGSYQLAFLVLAGIMLLACVGPFFIKAGGALSRRKEASSAH